MPRDANTAPEDDIAALVDDNDEESENSRRLLAQANTDHVSTDLSFYSVTYPPRHFFNLFFSVHYVWISFLNTGGTGEATSAMQQQHHRSSVSSTVKGVLLSEILATCLVHAPTPFCLHQSIWCLTHTQNAKKLETRMSKKSKSRRQYSTKPGDCYIKDGHQECVVGAKPNYVGASGPQNSNSNSNGRHFNSEEDYRNFLSQTNSKEQVGDCFISSQGRKLCVAGISVSTNTNKPKPKPKPKGEFNVDPEYERQMAEYERKKDAQPYSVPYDHVWWGMSWDDVCAIM
jgi:hypothetical protein